MKKLYLFLILILNCIYFISAQPIIEWQKCFGGTHGDWASAIQQTFDGGFIVAGNSFSNDINVFGHHGTNKYTDYWILKLDNFGNLQWQKSFGSDSSEDAKFIIQTNDHGFIIAGSSTSNGGDVTGHHRDGGLFLWDYWIVKLDSIGNLLWQKSLGGYGVDQAFSIQQTKEGGFIVAGSNNSYDGDVTGNHNGSDYWVVKLDADGGIEWQKSLGGYWSDDATSIQQTFDGGYIVAGSSDSHDGDVTGNHGTYDYWIVKLDSTGILEWQKSFGGISADIANSIHQTFDGGYIIAGNSISNDGDVTGNHGSSDYWIVKLDNTGSIVWQKSLGGSDIEDAKSIWQTFDGGFIVAGFSYSNDGDVTGHHGSRNFSDYWVVKLNTNGSIEWQKSLGGWDSEGAYSIQQTSDGGYAIAGYANSNGGDVTGNHGESDLWIVKLSSTVSVNEILISILDFKISPNPFSTETILSFKLASSKHVSLIISDIEGRGIKNICNKNFDFGTSEILWNGTNNSGSKVDDGIYFLTLVTDEICKTKRVVVLRN